MLIRKTGYVSSPRARCRYPRVAHGQAQLLANGSAQLEQQATLLHETRGDTSPRSSWAASCRRRQAGLPHARFLLGRGSVFCPTYPETNLNSAFLFAQLEDLADELLCARGAVEDQTAGASSLAGDGAFSLAISY